MPNAQHEGIPVTKTNQRIAKWGVKNPMKFEFLSGAWEVLLVLLTSFGVYLLWVAHNENIYAACLFAGVGVWSVVRYLLNNIVELSNRLDKLEEAPKFTVTLDKMEASIERLKDRIDP